METRLGTQVNGLIGVILCLRGDHNSVGALIRIGLPRDILAIANDGGRWALVDEFTEVESGKRNDRPELEKALSAWKRQKAKLRPCLWYFLGGFAGSEGKRGGEFYTPRSVVRVLVEMLEPYKGRVYDPCCCSGGMFVQPEKLAKELASRGIAANTVAPSAIETDIAGGSVRDDKQINEFIISVTALGRAGVADDIGPAVASLLTEDNRWINAQRIEISGGMFL